MNDIAQNGAPSPLHELYISTYTHSMSSSRFAATCIPLSHLAGTVRLKPSYKMVSAWFVPGVGDLPMLSASILLCSLMFMELPLYNLHDLPPL